MAEKQNEMMVKKLDENTKTNIMMKKSPSVKKMDEKTTLQTKIIESQTPGSSLSNHQEPLRDSLILFKFFSNNDDDDDNELANTFSPPYAHVQPTSKTPIMDRNPMFSGLINNFIKTILPVKRQIINNDDVYNNVDVDDDDDNHSIDHSIDDDHHHHDSDGHPSLRDRLTFILFKLPTKQQPKINPLQRLRHQNQSTQTTAPFMHITKLPKMMKQPFFPFHRRTTSSSTTTEDNNANQRLNQMHYELNQIRRQQLRLLRRIGRLIRDFEQTN